MNEKENLKVDIKNLKEAYQLVERAKSCLVDTEDFTEEQYERLYDIGEEINDLRIKLEVKLEKNGGNRK